MARLTDHFSQASLHAAPQISSSHPQLALTAHQSCANDFHVCLHIHTEYLVTQLVVYTNTHSSNLKI